MALVLGLIGEKLAGKDTVAEYLIDKHGAFHVRHSHILDEILGLLDLPISRRNEIDLGMALRGQFGEGIVGQGVRKRILTSTAPLIVIASIRFPVEVTNAKSLGAKTIYITAPLETRYQRFLQRQEKTDDGTQTLEEFKNVEEVEPTEIQIPTLGQQADMRIDNTGTLQELYRKVDEIIAKFKS
jgi:dephospho-CoA kinase